MLNGTLIAQIVHFCVGYYLLTHILLKPGLAVLQEYEARDARLNHDIVTLQQTLGEYEARRKKEWNECLQQLLREKPLMGAVMPARGGNFPMEEVNISEQEEAELVRMLEQRCREKLVDGKL